ncbi:MAG: hypothetical protein EOP50_20290 [Sphingobacteriales bacterium]|nr:MAG: hypothetical protein EOP50_20290 [Sphingobacteriales bacterium]
MACGTLMLPGDAQAAEGQTARVRTGIAPDVASPTSQGSLENTPDNIKNELNPPIWQKQNHHQESEG